MGYFPPGGGGGGGGGGTIDQITSSGDTLVITDPNGPATNIEVATPATVTEIEADGTGTVTVTNGGGPVVQIGVTPGSGGAAVVPVGTLGATPSVALEGAATSQVLGTLSADCALTLTGLSAGCAVTLLVTQGASAYTLSVNGTSVGSVPSGSGDVFAVHISSPDGSTLYIEPAVTISTPLPNSVTVMLTAPGIASLTQAQYNTLASWGVGSIVLGNNSGGGATWPYGFGGSAAFNGGSSNTFQNELKATAALAHAAGIKCYLGIYLQNYFWGTASTANPAPMLGSWSPTYTDANGNGYGSTTTAGSWLKMCFDYGAAVAVMNLDGMYWDTEGGAIGPSNNDYVTWQWRNYQNGYGHTSSEATEFANAQTIGADMMAAFNAGFQSEGGNAVISGSDIPVIIYQSTVAGLPQFQNGYLDVVETYKGTQYSTYIYPGGTTNIAYHTALGYSTWLSFITGVASETTAPVICLDSTFYGYQIVTVGGPYSGDGDGGFARALTANRTGLSGLSLPANVITAPFLWIYDSTTANGGAGIWPQSVWNEAVGSVLAGIEGTTYGIFQFTNLRSGSTLITNYADNTYNGSPNIDYVPLGGLA